MTCKSAGCFLVGVTGPGITANDEALIGSVSDDPYDIRTSLRLVAPQGTLAHIGTELVSTTEHSLIERGYFAKPGETTRGINQAGLAFSCAMVFENGTLERTNELTPFAEITTKLIRTCETVAEGIQLIRSVGAINPAFSVLLADAAGDLAHLEVGNFGSHVVHYYSHDNPGMVFAVNCYLSNELSGFNAPNAVIDNPSNNNLTRRQRGIELADQWRGRLDVNTLAILLSDHANRERDPLDNPLLPAWGYSICNHGTRGDETWPDEDLPWGTVSAEIMQPSIKSFWYAYGWPCGQSPEFGDQLFQGNSWGKFVPFGLIDKNHGGKETIELTTVDGQITPDGLRYQTDQQPAMANTP